jgi:hypothetical protein
MAKQTGLGDRLLVGGYNLSGDIGSLSRIGGGPAAMDMTDITQSAYDREGGLRDGGIDFTAWFDKQAGQAHPVLSALPRTDVIVSYLRGNAIGSPVASCVAKQLDYAGNRGADGTFQLTTSTVANGYGLEWGFQLSSGIQTDTAATDGVSVDGSASSSNGAQFYLHVVALTGTNVDVKVQDSANNSVWADLSGAAFTSATGVTSERIAVTGTVRRYLRVVSAGTFSSATFLVNAVRNETAVVF